MSSISERLMGTWLVVAFEFHGDEGEVIRPLGDKPKGIGIYDRGGFMSGQLWAETRPLADTNLLWQSPPEFCKQAFDSYIAYCGTYSIDEEEAKVTHYVAGSLLPDWVGEEQVRYYQLDGDKLRLSTPRMPVAGRMGVVHVDWVRAE